MTTDPASGGDSLRPDGPAPQQPQQAPQQPQAPQPPQYGQAQPHSPQASPGYPQSQPSAQPYGSGAPNGYPQAPHGQQHSAPQYGQAPNGQHNSGPQYGQAQPQQGTGPAPHGQAPNGSASKNEYFDFTGYRFRMPTAWPGSIGDAIPSFRSGISGIFQTSHMPMDARIGYWVWLVGCALAIIGWVFAMGTILIGILFNPVILMATGMMSFFGDFRWGVIFFYVASMLFSLIVLLIQLSLTLRIREGDEWARMALTILTVLSIVYAIILTAAGLESGGAGAIVTSVLSLLLLAFFWLPKANAWFLQIADGQASPARPARH